MARVKDYQDYGFAKFQDATDEALEAACFQAGQVWGLQGHKKLPRMAEVAVNGQTVKVPVVGSGSSSAKAFAKGWKAVK